MFVCLFLIISFIVFRATGECRQIGTEVHAEFGPMGLIENIIISDKTEHIKDVFAAGEVSNVSFRKKFLFNGHEVVPFSR